MATAKYGKGIVGLVKRGWNEIPEIMASSVLLLIGMTGASYAVYLEHSNPQYVRRYRLTYTVLRPDDPKVEKLKNLNALN